MSTAATVVIQGALKLPNVVFMFLLYHKTEERKDMNGEIKNIQNIKLSNKLMFL